MAMSRPLADTPPPELLQAALHLFASNRWRGHDGAADLFERAADLSMEQFDWTLGTRYYDAALESLKPQERLSDDRTAWLLANAARANVNSGDVIRGRELYVEALASFERTRDLRGWGTALLGWQRTYTLASEHVPDSASYERFLSVVDGDEAELRTLLLTNRAEASWLRRDGDDEQLAKRGLSLAIRTDDAECLTYAHATLGLVQARRLNAEAALRAFDASAEASRHIDNARIRGTGVARRAWPLLLMGKLGAAAEAADNARELALSGNDWPQGALSAVFQYLGAVFAGNSLKARILSEQSIMLVGRSRYGAAAHLLYPALATERSLRGEIDEAIDAAARWGSVAGRRNGRRLSLLMRARGGEIDLVRAEVLRDPPGADRLPELDFYGLGTSCIDIELADLLDAPELAEQAYDRLLATTADLRLSLIPPVVVSRVLAAAARLLGQYDRARTHLLDAARHAEAAGAAPERALVHFEEARLSVAAHGDRRSAIQATGSALQILDNLGLVWAESFVRSWADKAGLPTPRSTVVEVAPDELSETERAVLREFARSASVSEIADVLLVEERTAATLLDRVLLRLGINTPLDAEQLLKDVAAPAHSPSAATTDLTRRELEVLALIAAGMTNRQIAEELVISTHTAIRHVANILGKTDSANRTEAARWAVRNSLV